MIDWGGNALDRDYNVIKSTDDFRKFKDLIKENPTGFKMLLIDFFKDLSADDRKILLQALLGEKLISALMFALEQKEEKDRNGGAPLPFF